MVICPKKKYFIVNLLKRTVFALEILPFLGANISSLKIDDREFLYFSKERYFEEDFYSGCFNMFPTLCRLPDATYTFNGKRDQAKKKWFQIFFIHGLIRDETFSVTRNSDTIILHFNSR